MRTPDEQRRCFGMSEADLQMGGIKARLDVARQRINCVKYLLLNTTPL